MKNLYSNVACGGMDVHYKFSNVTFRDPDGNIVRRQQLRHPERQKLLQCFNCWPKGMPIAFHE